MSYPERALNGYVPPEHLRPVEFEGRKIWVDSSLDAGEQDSLARRAVLLGEVSVKSREALHAGELVEDDLDAIAEAAEAYAEQFDSQ